MADFFSKAAVLKKKYDWVGAESLYKQWLQAVDEGDLLKRGRIQEKVGYCLYRAAMQAESQNKFKEKMYKAVEAYEKAYEFYDKSVDENKVAWMFRCKAVSRDLSQWLTSDPSEKRRLLDECLELEREALRAFWDMGNKLEYGRTYNELSLVTWHRVYREWNREDQRRILDEGIRWGEKAVAAFSELGDSYESARAYFVLSTCLSSFLELFISGAGAQVQYRVKVIECLNKAVEISEKVGDAYIEGLSNLWLGMNLSGENSIRHLQKVLECGEKTRDNFLKGNALGWLAYTTWWKISAEEDPDEKRKLANNAMVFYDKEEHYLSILSFQTPRGLVIAPPGGYSEYWWELASWETNLEKKLEFLTRSVKVGTNAIKMAEDWDIPNVIGFMLHYTSKALVDRACLELDLNEKRNLLERALKYRERSIEIEERLMPFWNWDIGVRHNYLARIKAELANIEPDLNAKAKLLEESVSSWERCLKECKEGASFFESSGFLELYAKLRKYQETYSTLLTHLYDLTRKPEHLRRAIEVSLKAIESASKLDLVSRIAESYWKIAKTQDTLGNHSESAENFKRASESYIEAAEKIPQLKDFYQDYSTYMQSWNVIEKAKKHHSEKRYGEAKEHYERVAELHKSTERWGYLSFNYLAWARVEEAEDLSRREKTQEARDLFEQAANLFVEVKESIKSELGKIEAVEEKQIADKLVKVSDMRREYCLGRISLEEAKILDRQGDHIASSGKYGRSKEIFQKLYDTVENESERKEFKPIIYLCQAWEKKMMAEAKASPKLYAESAEFFKQANEHALDQQTSLLALANSSFCKALEAGAEFEGTRDIAMYITAKKHVEAATNYYTKAGYNVASEYAKATYRLFDAYMYTYKAQTEIDPEKKARFFQMAEKLLQTSADSYIKAKHPKKSEEILRVLKRVREDRNLAVSLTKILNAPIIASATSSFSTPTPTHEQAIGLERFEQADIQSKLILTRTEVKIGEDIGLELELVNAGKAQAQLIKVDEIIPEGFEVKKSPEFYRVEGSNINMKGKTLTPLKTEELKLVLKPTHRGTFNVKPKILYLEEGGKYMSHEPEPVTIIVRELGIGGWLRGPPR